jgi:uncharacterized protein (TIGR03032 family)
MELFVTNDRIHLGSQLGIISLINNTNPKINKDLKNGITYDHNYVANKFNITGDIDIHEVCEVNGNIFFASSLLNSICVIKPNIVNNFDIFWTPSFITQKNGKVPAEDRCHLNSFCLVDGKVKYACVVADTDVEGGWRDNRVGGGIIFDVETDEIVCTGLTMPHSLNYYNGVLYLLDSGTGRFGYINLTEPELGNRFKEICFIPGFLRGLKFIDTYAVIGMSMDRHEKLFSGLPLNDIMLNKKIHPRCGVKIVNIVTGDVEHSIEMENVMEIYGVGIVPNSAATRLLDLTNDSLVNAYKY